MIDVENLYNKLTLGVCSIYGVYIAIYRVRLDSIKSELRARFVLNESYTNDV